MNRKTFLPVVFLAFISPTIFADINEVKSNQTNTLAAANQKEHTDPIQIILNDHKQIKKLIGELEKNLNTNISQSRAIFKELKDFLDKHETMEQKTWYPELEKHNNLKDILSKLKKEEEDAGNELKNIADITDDKQWASKVKNLMKDVKQHASDEESKLFPKVKKELSKSSFEEIGEKMQDYRKQNDMQIKTRH